MKFTKMHGLGNDYIYVDGSKEIIPAEQKPDVVRKLSDRHFGIGGDGVIFINPSDVAEFEMEMWNADGTRAEMCGNGIRCVAKYVYDKGLTDKKCITIVSAGQVKTLNLTIHSGKVELVKVNMGQPELTAKNVPVLADTEQVINQPIWVQDREYRMTCVSMGNPHAVIFTEGVAEMDLEAIGPHFENHPRFPKRTNTEFVQIIDRNTVLMRVWERGSGETLACGTGASATAVACILNGLTEEQVTVKLLGGDLEIYWDKKDNCVYMTGPATTVFEGEVEI